MSTKYDHESNLSGSRPLMTAMLALRMAIGWHLFYEGITKLLAGGWSAQGYLSTAEGPFASAFQAIANTPWLLDVVNAFNAWGLTLIGAWLLVGGMTPVAAIAGAALLVLYSLAHPALPGMSGSALGGGNYLIVDRNLVEAIALVAIAMLPPAQLPGVDRLLSRRSRKGVSEARPAGRRELIRDLSGIPVLGAIAAAVVAGRAAAAKPSAVDALSGATSLAPVPPLFARKGNIVSVRDFERLAQDHMTPTNYAYVSGGAADEQTLRWNETAYREIHLRLQVIHSRAEPDTRITLLGRERPHPILLAPARQADIHPEGELATVRGAGSCGTITIISTAATMPVEKIAEAASEPVWYQAYLYKDRERSRDNVQRAEAAGYEVICVTVDSASNGPRDRQYRHARMRDPERFSTHHGKPWNWPTTWEDFAWYRSLTKLPVIPKGVMTPEDAERGLELGADGIYISNHGARNLDAGIAPIQVLPAIAERVAGRVPIIIDGGIRRGTDVLKALSLGATAVAVGRPFLYGLAVNGADGVAAVVNILWNELEMSMISTRQTSLKTLSPEAFLENPRSPFFSS